MAGPLVMRFAVDLSLRPFNQALTCPQFQNDTLQKPKPSRRREAKMKANVGRQTWQELKEAEGIEEAQFKRQRQEAQEAACIEAELERDWLAFAK